MGNHFKITLREDYKMSKGIATANKTVIQIRDKQAVITEFPTETLGWDFEHKGKEFFLIFGKHINGGFASVVNKKVSCELGYYKDRFYNTERLSSVLKGKSNVKLIVDMIADNEKYDFEKIFGRELCIDFNGYCFLVIFGECNSKKFCIIPNWCVSCELHENLSDIEKNTESINKVLKNKESACAIATVLATA
jgi:hypothetical protein